VIAGQPPQMDRLATADCSQQLICGGASRRMAGSASSDCCPQMRLDSPMWSADHPYLTATAPQTPLQEFHSFFQSVSATNSSRISCNL
jgi:hypothetical protein